MSAIFFLALALLPILWALDWLQTLTIARNPTKWHEGNPAIAYLIVASDGDEPLMTILVSTWFAVTLVAAGLVIAAAYNIAGPAIAIWLAGALAGMELTCTLNNHLRGIRPANPKPQKAPA